MRCRFGLRVIEYAALFETPLFGLAKRQTDVLEACFRRTEQSFPLELGDLRAPGGETYADLVAAVRYPRLRGAVEVRVNRLTGRFEGLASKEEADQSMLFLSQCQQAVNGVFPDLLVASTSMNVMSWLSCEGDSHAVEELLAARQHVQLDAAAAGAERARFFVRGQLVNDADGWSVSFGLEPSVLRDYGLYFICQGNYIVSGTYPLISDQDTHLGKLAETVLHQFGFEATG